MARVKEITMSKNTKTLLFALLVLSLAVPVTANAQEQTSKTYDPIVTQYLSSVLYEPSTIQQKTVDDQTIITTTHSTRLSDGKYQLQSNTTLNGKQVISETFQVTANPDETYRLTNDSLGLDEIFTDKKPDRIKRGTGSSNPQKATISLYDKERGTPNTLKLYDNYSGCLNFNQAVFQAVVRPDTIDVTWEASPFYAHYCIIPLEFDSGKIQYGTDVHYLSSEPNHADRRSYHAFTNESKGTTWYSVSATFFYKL